ncbi:MAG: tetraacyldisaccharide 4'-kinase [Armatimonadetes bacterium]|nr:tetraacyldisaccharide 4'-kinase [Armatimonadota bacterium]
MVNIYLERLVSGEERGFFSWVIRGALWPLTIVYRVGLAVYLSIYAIGLRKKYRLKVPVISVGNLTFGGTGKTPAVQAICRMLTERGKRVVILSRGHGGSAAGTVIVSDGKSILCENSESGDEPMLLAATLPGVPVVVGKDRRLTGKLACERFDPDVIILDDGLQYWQLHRDLDIVVLDAMKPFGSGWALPAGDLREPVSGLKRAGIVLLGNALDMPDDMLGHLTERIRRIAPEAKQFKSAHRPVYFRNAATGEILDIDWVWHLSVVAFCGIGKPRSFIDMLESLDAYVRESLVFPDHHAYGQSDFDLISRSVASRGAQVVITTAKDLARIGGNMPIQNLYVLDITLEIEDSSSFASIICNKIDDQSEKAAAR